MKYKNVSNKVKNFKINREWQSVQPEEVFEGPVNVVVNESELELIVEKKEKEVKKPEVKEEKDPLDLNNDGKVDKKDASIAGKVMAKIRHKKKKGNKSKK